jgi:hypothetical protein
VKGRSLSHTRLAGPTHERAALSAQRSLADAVVARATTVATDAGAPMRSPRPRVGRPRASGLGNQLLRAPGSPKTPGTPPEYTIVGEYKGKPIKRYPPAGEAPEPKVYVKPPVPEVLPEGTDSVVKNPPGRFKVKPETEAGTWMHENWETIEDYLRKNAEAEDLLAEKLPKGLEAEHPVPVKGLPPDQYPRIDRLNRADGEVIELKPKHLFEKGLADAQYKASQMDLLEPLPNGAKWKPRCVTYSQEKVMAFLRRIGFLEPETPVAPKGGKAKGGKAKGPKPKGSKVAEPKATPESTAPEASPTAKSAATEIAPDVKPGEVVTPKVKPAEGVAPEVKPAERVAPAVKPGEVVTPEARPGEAPVVPRGAVPAGRGLALLDRWSGAIIQTGLLMILQMWLHQRSERIEQENIQQLLEAKVTPRLRARLKELNAESQRLTEENPFADVYANVTIEIRYRGYRDKYGDSMGDNVYDIEFRNVGVSTKPLDELTQGPEQTTPLLLSGNEAYRGKRTRTYATRLEFDESAEHLEQRRRLFTARKLIQRGIAIRQFGEASLLLEPRELERLVLAYIEAASTEAGAGALRSDAEAYLRELRSKSPAQREAEFRDRRMRALNPSPPAGPTIRAAD